MRRRRPEKCPGRLPGGARYFFSSALVSALDFFFLVPFALVGLLLSTFWLRKDVYELVLVLQLVFYALSVLSMYRAKVGIVLWLSDISLAFIVLNTAAVVAFIYFITGKKAVWAR